MHSADHQTLFSKWLDNQLDPQEREAFEQLCVEDPAFAAMVDTANRLTMGAEQFEQLAVPAWDKEKTFMAAEKPKWWMWSGFPVASMAMSVLALVLVTTGFHVDVEDGKLSMGFQMGFDQAPDEAAITAMVNERLDAYQQNSQSLLAQYLDALNTQQKENSAQLTQYLLSSSRQERREDFAELVKFINQQRTDDQRFVARQINHLQQEISAISADYTVVNTPTEFNDE